MRRKETAEIRQAARRCPVLEQPPVGRSEEVSRAITDGFCQRQELTVFQGKPRRKSLSRHDQGEVGRRAWERCKGRAFKSEGVPFGKVALYPPVGAASRLELSWRQWVWLRISTNNDENKL